MLAEGLADIRSGRISVLVAVRVDRIERRGIRHVFNLIEEVRQAGGRLEFSEQPFLNASGPGSDVMLANLASMAGEESRIKSQRTVEGQAKALANGGGTPSVPWGDKLTGAKRNKKVIPTADGRKGGPEIFQRIADGHSPAAVPGWLSSDAARQWAVPA